MVLLNFNFGELGCGEGMGGLEGDGAEGRLLMFAHREILNQKLQNNHSIIHHCNKMRGSSQTTLDGRQRSMIANLYTAWDQHQIPAIHYHYILAILSRKSKQDQIKVMNREIKQMKQGVHSYHQIMKWLQTRENSLQKIKENIDVLLNGTNHNQFQMSEVEQDEATAEYSLVFESRTKERRTNRKLQTLVNHLKSYQQVTFEVTSRINGWEIQMRQLGYDGFIQFLYQHEDYLQKMLEDTAEILQNYEQFFENNLFLIFKKNHQFTQYSLIYDNLKFHPDFAIKIQMALEIISTHHSQLERYRILGSYRQLGSRKKLQKIQSMKGLYCKYHKDTLLVKDTNLLGDKYKLAPNKHVLVNPEAPTLPKFNPQYSVLVNTQSNGMERRANRSEVKLKPLSHRVNIIAEAPPESKMDEPVVRKKLQMLKDLSSPKASLPTSMPSSPSYPSIATEQPRQSPKVQAKQTIQSRVTKAPSKQLYKESITQYKIQFIYQKGIPSKDIFKYLREDIFIGNSKDQVDVESVAKLVFQERERITFVRAVARSMLVAWLAVVFVNKDHSLSKSVEIKFLHKFLKIPNFENQLIQDFIKKGYGIVKKNGKVLSEYLIKQKMFHQLAYVHYKVRDDDQHITRKVIKGDDLLKHSRILKYYTYSTQSKYHVYCEHRPSECRIGFEVEEVSKISLAGDSYVKAKCDSIKKVGDVWKIDHHLNKYSLVIGQSIKQILAFGELSSVDFNSSFESSQNEEEKKYLCLPEVKCMHKYVDSKEKSIVAEYLKVNGEVVEVRSVRVERKELRDCLVVDRPFVLAFVCNSKQDYGKTLALLNFQ